MYKKLSIIMIFCVACIQLQAQDTASVIRDFNKVLSFSQQPFVHYNSFTKMQATPVLQAEDTLSTKGEFYKNGANYYYSNGQEEIFMQDTFMIQFNHTRRSIWISKSDASKMNALPLNNKEMQSFLRGKYTIQKTGVNASNDKIRFETKEDSDKNSSVTVNIQIEYERKTYIPRILEMNAAMKKPVDEEMLGQIQEETGDIKTAVVKEGTDMFIVRNQGVKISFENISFNKDKAVQMPVWKDRLTYDIMTKEFLAKGIYNDYEITKTF
ncbi:MAG: hypothetical protein H7320_19965 [Ferruginibacter sp.]|nr:hypothetical protein [Ferruginibacter sp.]